MKKYTVREWRMFVDGEAVPVSSRLIRLMMRLRNCDAPEGVEVEIPENLARGILAAERLRALRLLQSALREGGSAA